MSFTKIWFTLLKNSRGKKKAIEVLIKALLRKKKIKEEIGFTKPTADKSGRA